MSGRWTARCGMGAIALLALTFSYADRPTGAAGSAHGSLTFAISASLPASLPAAADRGEVVSPLRQALAPRSRAGVLPVVRLQVDAEAHTALRDELRRRGSDEIVMRDFVLAPEQPGNAPRFVDLEVYSIPVFSEYTQFVDGSRPGGGLGEPLPKPDVTLLGGHVAGEFDSKVFLSMSPHGTHGYVRIGTRLQIISSGPHGDGRELIIYDSHAMPEEEIPWRDFVCGVHDVPENAAALAGARFANGGGAASAASSQCRRVVVAIETDYEYTANVFGGNTGAAAAYAATLIAASSEIFTAAIGVNLQIGFVRLWTEPNDPWTAGGTQPQLKQFQEYWNQNMMGVPRHLAHFLSGRNLGGGIAYLNAVCHATNGYALSSGMNGFFPYPLQNNHSQNWDIFVVAHEFGHNFGVKHTHDYCPPIDQCASGSAMGECQTATICQMGTLMSYCHSCGSGMSNVVLAFHPQIAADMLAFVDSIPPAACSLACDPWAAIPDGDFCFPASPMPCPEPKEHKPAEWDDWDQLLRNGGWGALDEEAFDDFGFSVAVDGDVAIVGARGHDWVVNEKELIVEAGAAYVFRFHNGQWVEVAKLEPPFACAEPVLHFGTSVAIASSPHADIAVIGAPFATVDNVGMAGAAWVFRRIGPTYPEVPQELWLMEGLIDDDEKDPDDPPTGCEALPRLSAGQLEPESTFGHSVAIMPFRIGIDACGGGDVIIVGAPTANPHLECGGFVMQPGAGYVFRYDPRDGGWREESKLVPTCSMFAQFGVSVAAGYSTIFNEEVLIGGAWLASATAFPPPDDDDKNGDKKEPPQPPAPINVPFAGAIYTFRGSTFIDGEGILSAFWYADSALNAEHPRVADLFGLDVHFDSHPDTGDVIIAGAPWRDLVDPKEPGADEHFDLATDEGAAFILRRPPGAWWHEEAEIYSPSPQTNAVFGGAVGVSGSMVVVGAYGQEGQDPDDHEQMIANMGSAYVYRHFEGTWDFERELFPYSFYAGQADDHFGISVGISNNSIVVGARREHQNNVEGAGAAYTFGRCPPPCPGSGSCFSPSPTIGCASGAGACCTAVCAKMPFCCDGFWGMACVAEAMTVCGGCGQFESGPCMSANGSPGCANGECCAAVCTIDEHCCAVEWDESCATLAASVSACMESACPSEGDCMNAHGGQGCDDEECCEAICSDFPLCCQNSWDDFCAEQAAKICAAPCPADLTGSGAVGVFDLLQLLGSWGPCADCEDCPADINGVGGEPDCAVNVFDLLALLGAWGPCP